MTEKRNWFLFKEGDLTGPMRTDEVEARLGEECLVWWPGGTPLEMEEWRARRESILQDAAEFYYLEGDRTTPRSLEDIVQLVSQAKSSIQLYDHDRACTYQIFDSPSICAALGLRPRKNVRTSISGSALLVSGPDLENKTISPLITLSSEGIGLQVSKGFMPEGPIAVYVRSQHLAEVIPFAARSLYNHDGQLGLKVERIEPRHRALIHSYIEERAGRLIHGAAA